MTTLPQKLQAALDAVRASVFDGECSASLAELARPLGVPGRTMRRRLQRLEDLGYLRIERLPGRSSIYRLTPKGRGLSGLGGILRRLFVQRGRGAKAPLHPSASAPPHLETVGRQDILATLRENVAKRRPTLLVGPLGVGKSHILREFSARASRCLEVN
jgi:DNA-binding transcriptional ArsR family regulator